MANGALRIAALLGMVGVVSAQQSSPGAAAPDPSATEYAYPEDANVRNVKKDFGAKGDGTSDDTAALQSAFNACSQKNSVLYFPAGTYLVSDRVWFAITITVIGQSRDKTTIRLKDECAGFQDPSAPRAAVSTVEPKARAQTLNTNFVTHMLHMTVDTGRRNPGAIGIEFMSHNGGGLEDVTVRSGDGAGVMGVDMRREDPGPAFCKNVRVEGFDVGFTTHHSRYASTFEHIALQGQKVVGWHINRHPVTVRGLTSVNKVPAVKSDGNLVLLGATLRGGQAGAAAIESKGSLYLRDITVDGYTCAARLADGAEVPAPVTEYLSPQLPRTAQHGMTRGSLKLAVRDTPPLPWDPPSEWANVLGFGEAPEVDIAKYRRKRPGRDITVPLQKAIDSGKSTIYLPTGNYIVRDTIRIRAGVRVIQGCSSTLFADSPAMGPQAKPIFLFDGAGDGPLFLNQVKLNATYSEKTPGPEHHFVHASPRPLVFLRSTGVRLRTAAPASGGRLGDLFMEDLCGNPMLFDQPQNVWLRQCNTEGSKHELIVNRAASLWILGLKTEGDATIIRNAGPQARTEVLGGLVYTGKDDGGRPAFLYEGGAMSLIVSLAPGHLTLLKETAGGGGVTIQQKKAHDYWRLHYANYGP